LLRQVDKTLAPDFPHKRVPLTDAGALLPGGGLMPDERFKNCQGNFARRALELGSLPYNPNNFRFELYTLEEAGTVSKEAWDYLEDYKTPPLSKIYKTPPLSKIRLMQAISEIDPDLADMIEALDPVYLVKR
jgi:hypothetical protein